MAESFALKTDAAPELSGRRRALLGITSAVGAGGAVAAVAPFIAGMRPNRKTQAAGAPVAVEVGDMTPGELRTVTWRLKPVWLLRRSAQMTAALANPEGTLSDPDSESSLQPDYCKNQNRSIKPEYLVAIGLCTHLGCIPGRSGGDGFLCACHGSRFDFAGRVFAGSPAPANLIIPPHHYDGETRIVIGQDPA